MGPISGKEYPITVITAVLWFSLHVMFAMSR